MMNKKHATPRFWGLLLILTILAFTILYEIIGRSMSENQKLLDQLTQQRTDLQNQVKEMEEKWDYMQSEAYAEQRVRDLTGKVKPGETLFIFRN